MFLKKYTEKREITMIIAIKNKYCSGFSKTDFHSVKISKNEQKMQAKVSNKKRRSEMNLYKRSRFIKIPSIYTDYYLIIVHNCLYVKFNKKSVYYKEYILYMLRNKYM